MDAKQIEELKAAGAGLANIAFNLAQRVGSVLTERDCQVMHDARIKWDVARKAQPTPTSAAEGVQSIDTAEFRNLSMVRMLTPEAQDRLIAHIDTKMAEHGKQQYQQGRYDAETAALETYKKDRARWEVAEARVRELEAAAKGLPIKPWRERVSDKSRQYWDDEARTAIAAEIAELRAALKANSAALPTIIEQIRAEAWRLATDRSEQDEFANTIRNEAGRSILAVLKRAEAGEALPGETGLLLTVASEVRLACMKLYSPDDTAGDWSDKMAALELMPIIDAARAAADGSKA